MNKSTYRRSVRNLWKLYETLGLQNNRQEERQLVEKIQYLFCTLYNVDPEFDYATVETLRIMIRIQGDLFPVKPSEFGQYARVKTSRY
jgi:hypothetical protein